MALKSPNIGKYVVVRTYSAGVHLGVLEAQMGKEVILRDSRRIWSWKGAFTLSAVVTTGPKEATVSCAVDLNHLTEAVEVIPLTQEAEIKFRNWPVHDPSNS